MESEPRLVWVLRLLRGSAQVEPFIYLRPVQVLGHREVGRTYPIGPEPTPVLSFERQALCAGEPTETCPKDLLTNLKHGESALSRDPAGDPTSWYHRGGKAV